MKKFFVFTLFACLLFLSAPAMATDWLHFFFPFIETPGEPNPSETLQAPFADAKPVGPSKGDATQGTALPENAVPLNFPHRNAEQIGEWVVMATAEAMSFASDNFEDDLKKNYGHFTPEGKTQYDAFLEENSVFRILRSKKFYLRSFVQEAPLLLNEGAVDGRYRWLYEVPIMVSYMDRGMKDYKNATPPVNQLVSVTVQVGRTADVTPGKDLLIERWSGKAQKITKD